ncbi:MAG: undecaprenyl-diphosphate phosphatase [Clostridia bacterium]|nr:undecaprenyl-diphosphate phosphatase [Clostridia bacterium]
MYNAITAFLIGIIEGITEWLPVSSTGHMILFEELMPLNMTDAFKETFLVVVQLGAILAVVLLYWKKLFPFSFKKDTPVLQAEVVSLWIKIFVSCIPAAIVGILLDDVFERLFYKPVPVAIALIVVGAFFILIENYNKRKIAKKNTLLSITLTDAAIIGLFQVIAAVFPGVSRSGATIIGAILIGISRTVAAEYTFFLAVPVMAGASLLKLLKIGFSFTAYELLVLAVGLITAFVVSLIAIKFLVGYVKKHDFKVFGVYRIILGLAVIILLEFIIK